MTVEYKKGFEVRMPDNTTIRIIKPARGIYQVTGFYGKDYGKKYLELFYSPEYASLKGVANYLKRNFDMDLVF